MEVKTLVSILGVWSGGAGSLQRKLADALIEGVRHGGLPPGVRLPSERAAHRASRRGAIDPRDRPGARHAPAGTTATTRPPHGVVVVPGPTLSAGDQHDRFIRITFLAEPDTLTAGVTRLSAAWRHYRTSKPRSREPAVLI